MDSPGCSSITEKIRAFETRIYLTIVPGILADFKKVLAKAEAGQRVSESYRFEDGDGAVFVTGSKDAAGNLTVEAELRSSDRR